MGTIDERRKLIVSEMELGRGSPEGFNYPVSLEPPFNPFSIRPERKLLHNWLFQSESKERPHALEKPETNRRLRFIRIKPSKDDGNSLESAEQFILSLPASSPTAFEIIGHGSKIAFQITIEDSQADAIVAQFRSHFPGTDAYPEEDNLKAALPLHSFARAYRLKASHCFPLCPVSDRTFEPYRTLFGCLGGLEHGSAGALQVLFTPVVNYWQDNMRRVSRSPYDPGHSPFVDLPLLPKLVDKKLARPLFAVSLRMLASDEALFGTMEGFLKQFDSMDNGILPIYGAYPVESIMARNTRVHGAILNSMELSYFVHLPAPELIESMPCIERAVKSYPVPNEFTSDGPILGINTHRGMRRTVRHSPGLPNRHVYVTGKSGYGKSNLILYSAIQRIERGDGVGIIDPHGSLIREGILPRIPKDRIADVVYLNAGDFEHPMAINPMAHSGAKLEKEHIRVDLLNFFEDLFEAPLGVNIQHALNFFIVSLLTRRDSTLSDIERLLLDKNWRNALVDSIDDDRVRMFWEHEFPQLEKRGIITAITNKLSPLILPDSAIAPMLKQRENKLDFLKVMDGKKILLCNLSHGDVGKRNSQLLGKLLVSKLQIAAMMREGNETSPDFYLYIDEFQHMVCPSMADILSGARKYGLHLWLTNQMTGDIPDSILRHVFNASTLIFFASDSPNDQTLIEKNLSKKFKAEDIGQLKRGETFVKMVGGAFNMTTERMSTVPNVGWVDEIVAASRAKYTAPPVTQTAFSRHSSKVYKTRPAQSALLSAQEKSFLECAYHNPTLSVTALYKEHGLSAYMGDRFKKALKDNGLVKEVTTHLGSGSRVAKFLLLTPQGFSALGADFDSFSGKGGPLHRYWQSLAKSHAEGNGYRAVIEEPIPDTKETVDLGLMRDGKRLAVEISITTKVEHEIGNTQKCLQAQYDRVIVLFLDEDKLAAFQGLSVNTFNTEERPRVSAGLAYDFCRFW